MPAPFVENAVFFSTGWFYLLCQRSSDRRCMSSSHGLQFCPIDLPVCHCTSTLQFFYLFVCFLFFYHKCSVVQLKVRHGDFTRSSFIVENSFCYSGFFVTLNELANCSFYLYEELIWMGITLTL